MRHTRWLAAFFFTAALVCAGRADDTQALQTVVTESAAKLPAGGIVAAEIDVAGVRFSGAGRFAPREGLAPERVIFEIGSITKVFTALLLAETVAEGKASLDDRIAQHLPTDLKLHPNVAAITLAQLSSHTSGLPGALPDIRPADPLDPYADFTVKQLLASVSALRPQQPPPQPAEYSNLGVGLLGFILERIHGRSYGELVAERITGPLGMRDTSIVLSPDQQPRFAIPHDGARAVKPWQIPGLPAAGALHSTAADLALFAQSLLDGRDARLAEAWRMICRPRTEFQGGRLGLGILIGEVDGTPAYSHSGGTGGFRTHLELVPARGQAVVVLINNTVMDPAGVVADWRVPAALRATRVKVPLAPDRLAEFTGCYELAPGALLTILAGPDGRLRVRLTGQQFLPVYSAGGDRFFYRVVAAELRFVRSSDGQVVAVALLQNGRELPAKRRDAPPTPVLFTTQLELQDYPGKYRLPGLLGLGSGTLFEIRAHDGTLYA
jgi:CubicO group peptidase (beta-lactamase class C family)